MRRAHHAMKALTLTDCKKCGEKNLPHTACASCGTYAGRKVVAKKDPLAKHAGHKH
jgi:large subunit ribosomal protein L32